MNEIKQRAKHAHLLQLFLIRQNTCDHVDWCAIIGLYETSGWVNETKNRNNMFEWLRPGNKYI